MIDFKGSHFEREIVLWGVRWYVAYLMALSRQPGLAARSHTGNSDGMKPPPDPDYRHRFPAEIIRHAVWLYHVFSLSLRDVELLLAGALPTACAADGHGPGTSGTSTRCSSGSRAYGTIFGAAWISTALCSTSSFRSAEMPKPPSASSGAC